MVFSINKTDRHNMIEILLKVGAKHASHLPFQDKYIYIIWFSFMKTRIYIL
jgi:hypothetical protein